MIRTRTQIGRRRALGQAASHGTAVILYVMTADPRTSAVAVTDRLRAYAHARDWHVAEVVLDASPLATALDSRQQWAAVREAIVERRADGVVALAGQVPPLTERWLAWLTEQASFFATVPFEDCLPHVQGSQT
ncbi:hypothetical protein [Streptomyces buecherae]|uniref:hypothetical protein n=1 Tax=Streptomyces buecherae TaxID=2763006 RepID=UPI001C26C84A|nr:hypothetical protein [Streptomyces buecherae]